MRNTKFRVWDKVNKKWIKEDITISFDGVIRILHLGKPTELVDYTSVDIEFSTGLHDKNGKEIYEGDVLKDDCDEIGIVRFGKLPLDKSGDCVCTYLAYYVECKGKLGQAPTYECADIGDWMEVIGNQWDKNY